ncbi:MAG: maleylpyruvate isomerase family mycothiol-dependent enzyme [Streptosporangiaceae bacterium]
MRHSHDALRATVEPLEEDRLRQRSYCSEWSIAHVLSHLGSGAEIFGLFLDAGLSGVEPPGGDSFPPIWQAWNERSPHAQATDALAADEALVKRLESLTPDELDRIRLQLFGMDLDVTGLAKLRLGEHAVHSWDVAVALDPAATVSAEAVGLLIDGLGPLIGRAGRPAASPLTVHVTTTGPDREFVLETGEAVRIDEAGEGSGGPRLKLSAEAFLRLVYGRLDHDHTPPVETVGVELDDLRKVFPGF